MNAPPLAVVAVGGNLLTPPTGDLSVRAERPAVQRVAAEIAPFALVHRLLIVHGNGPQVGRLLGATDGNAGLDVVVAQSQGELGYLLCEALDGALGAPVSVAIVTRVLVDALDPASTMPSKPIGPVLTEPPTDGPAARTPDGRGWRRIVSSPRPRAIVELDPIRHALTRHHVVAGGGGGVPLGDGAAGRVPRPAVVDKDRVAALLAVTLEASCLIFMTDVAAAYDNYGGLAPRPIPRMSATDSRARLAAGVFAAGSMEPKVESAVEFVEATGRRAVITTLGALAPALAGRAGTTIDRASG